MASSSRDRFDRIGRVLDEVDAADLREAAVADPGDKIVRSLAWSQAWLGEYQRRLEMDPAFAAAEDERRLRKAHIHLRWRAVHSTRG